MRNLTILALIFSLLSASIIITSCSGCKVKENRVQDEISAAPARELSSQKNKEEEDTLEDKRQTTQIVSSDSTYAIVFYNENGDSIGYYDIWENNPFSDLTFDRIQDNTYEYRKKYRVPGLTKSQLKGKVEDRFLRYIKDNVEINLICNITNVFSDGSEYIGICYTMVALEGYPEEDTNLGICNVINVVDKNGKIINSVEIPIKSINRNIAITQDGKYLVYLYSTVENNWGCFDIYNLIKEEVVYTYCVKKGYELHGAFLHNSSIIGMGEHDPLHNKNSMIFWVVSKDDMLYYDEFPPRFGNYKHTDIGLIKPMKGTPHDTIPFSNMQSKKLNR